MARIRSLKPEFWVSEQVAECSTSARLTFVGLWTFSDDRGVHPAKPKTLKAELFPMDDITASDVAGLVDELIRVGLVAEFEAGGERFWHVTGWEKHQKIDRPSFKYPEPPTTKNSATDRGTFDEGSTNQDRRSLDDDSSNARRAPPPGVDRKGVDRKGVDDSSKARRTTSRTERKTRLPDDFGISERVRAWAADKGFSRLDEHLEAFRLKAKAKGYTNVDWDATFMGAVREDWAKLRTGVNGAARSVLDADETFGDRT